MSKISPYCLSLLVCIRRAYLSGAFDFQLITSWRLYGTRVDLALPSSEYLEVKVPSNVPLSAITSSFRPSFEVTNLNAMPDSALYFKTRVGILQAQLTTKTMKLAAGVNVVVDFTDLPTSFLASPLVLTSFMTMTQSPATNDLNLASLKLYARDLPVTIALSSYNFTYVSSSKSVTLTARFVMQTTQTTLVTTTTTTAMPTTLPPPPMCPRNCNGQGLCVAEGQCECCKFARCFF